LSLIANLSALAARWLVPLESAPKITTMIALAVQALPIVILCAARDEWLQRRATLLAAALLLSLPAGCDEVWLNTINSQFHVAIAVALCLVLQVPASRALRGGSNALLLVGPLCSPITGALFPLFLLRAISNRDRARIAQALFLLVGCFVQFTFFYHSMPYRRQEMGLSVLVCVFMAKNLALPLLGWQSGEVVAAHARALLAQGIHPFFEMLSCLLFLATISWAAFARRRLRPEPMWLLLAAGTIAVCSYFGSLGPHIDLVGTTGSNRYAFVPNVLGALAILALIDRTQDRITMGACAAVVWLLAIGFQDYVDPSMKLRAGPSWADGVRVWRSNPSALIPIWPDGWSVKL